MAIGGMERAVLEICTASHRQGLRSLVVSRGGPWASALRPFGVRHVELPLDDPDRVTSCAGELAALLEVAAPGIVHARSRVPRIATVDAIGRLHPAVRPGFVVTAHSHRDADDPAQTLTAADVIIAVSHHLARHLLSRHPSLAERVRVIPRGVDLAYFDPSHRPASEWLDRFRRHYPELEGKRLVSLVARLSRWKGQHRFLGVLSRLASDQPRIHGLIVGSAPHRHNQAYARRLRLRARWFGKGNLSFVEAEPDVRNIYALSQVVVSLSHKPPETFGRTLMEALASGVPVVGYDHGGVSESAFQIFPAGAVPPLDDQTLTARVREFLHRAPRVPPIPASWGSDIMAARVLSIYRELRPALGG